jgi:catechol 2,3-dioxygenase-like lactoylglutathione lyase family enzyme
MSAESEDMELAREHQLHGVQPVLPVSDVSASADFFRKVLGFEIDFLEGDPPTHGRVKVVGDWGHPIYIHLSLAEPGIISPSGEIRIHVGRDLDGLFETYRRLGAEVVFSPVSQPWGLREFAVREPSQHVLRFCAEV